MGKKIRLANQRPTVRDLDDLAREVVRKRDKVCRVCGSNNYLQTAHFISRSNRAVRWSVEDNLYLLCSGCHMMRNTSWHKDPGSAVEWVKDTLGKYNYAKLRLRANCKGLDLRAVELYLKGELKKYESTKNAG